MYLHSPPTRIVCVCPPGACTQQHAPKYCTAQERLCSRAQAPLTARLHLTTGAQSDREREWQ
eukprot:1161762-Pelagomonas_calceolata.AAC.6